jgi:hypothetical protein
MYDALGALFHVYGEMGRIAGSKIANPPSANSKFEIPIM